MIEISLFTALSLISSASDSTRAATTVESEVEATRQRQVALRVESKALLEQQAADVAEDTSYFVRTDGTKALTDTHGVRVVDDPAAPVIIVSLSWVSYAESIYGVRIEAARSGKPPELVESFKCECSDSELTEAVLARFPAALEQLEATAKPAVADPSPVVADEPEQPVAEPVTGTDGDRPRQPLGRLGRAGIGTAAVGLGTLVAGGVVYAQGRRPDDPLGTFEDSDGLNFKPPGIALMVTGGAVLVTGAVLLVVDRRRARRSSSAMLLPSPGGLVVAGRF